MTTTEGRDPLADVQPGDDDPIGPFDEDNICGKQVSTGTNSWNTAKCTREPHPSSAVLSDCGTYRYELRRIWDSSLPLVGWMLLNPSVADAERNDPTVRRCIGFARSWGYGGLVLGNLFALISTDPAALLTHPDPIGPDNDQHILSVADECAAVVVAWGSHRMVSGRAAEVLTALTGAGVEPMCLGRTTTGRPRHPLYVRASMPLAPYVLAAEGGVAC